MTRMPRVGRHEHHEGHERTPGRERAGHEAHAGHSVATFRDKFFGSLLLTVPTLIWGHMLPQAFGYRAPRVPGAHWIPVAFGTAVFF
jgi:P-type Cu2+ transporter